MRFRRIGRRLAAAVAAWFCSLNALGKIGVSVASIHLIALLVLGINHLSSPSKIEKRPIAVRIHQPIAAPPPKRVEKTQHAKREIAKAPQKKAPKPAKKNNPAPATPLPTRKTIPEIRLPSYVEEARIETVIESHSDLPSFGHHLAISLQEQLQLPEIGEVAARIVLEAPGNIILVEILDSRSSKNAEWLKKQLPHLSVPCFNDFSISDAKLEFTITFRNVEKI